MHWQRELLVLAACAALVTPASRAEDCGIERGLEVTEREQLAVIARLTDKIVSEIVRERALTAEHERQLGHPLPTPWNQRNTPLDVLLARSQVSRLRIDRFVEQVRLKDIRLIAHLAVVGQEDTHGTAGLEVTSRSDEDERLLARLTDVSSETYVNHITGRSNQPSATSRCDLHAALSSAAESARGPGAGTCRAGPLVCGPFATRPNDISKDALLLARLANLEITSRDLAEAVREDLRRNPGATDELGMTWLEWSALGRISDEEDRDGGFFNNVRGRLQDEYSEAEDRRFGYPPPPDESP